MKKILSILVVFAFLVPSAGCPKSTEPVVQKVEPIVNGVIDCAKAEAASVGKQVSVIQVGLDVAGAILMAVTNGGDINAAVDSLIAKYKPMLGDHAEALVACAVYAVENGGAQPPATGSGSGSGSAVVVAEGSGSGSAAPTTTSGGAMAMMLKSAGDKEKAAASDVIAKHGWKFAK